MARNQQTRELRQQVERLVTEGKAGEAYRLLKKEAWIPGGSGHQEFYPFGLTLYAKVDWEKQILVSEGGRYWAWEVTLLSPDQYTFVYPTSRQFPFSDVCSKIVRELEKRNWDVEGIQVEFVTFGTGAKKSRVVNYIYGKDFKLSFSYDGAVSTLNIPKMELSVYHDESGPTLDVYVGDNFERDQERFVNSLKVNSKLNKEPRMYLKYKGSWQKPEEGRGGYSYSNQRAPYLVHNNDLNREYELEAGDKPYFVTEELMKTFRKWLEDFVLSKIINTPIPESKPKKGELPAQPPFPENIGPLYCFADRQEAERISTGRANPSQLSLDQRYGLIPGYRLVELGVSNDGTFPEIAYDGFCWCGIGEVTSKTNIDKIEINGYIHWRDREPHLVKVTPKSANGIYVADISSCKLYKEEIFRKNPKQQYLTDAEFKEYFRCSGRTIIPITEYKGNYKKPVVLINRELGLDEVEIVK